MGEVSSYGTSRQFKTQKYLVALNCLTLPHYPLTAPGILGGSNFELISLP